MCDEQFRHPVDLSSWERERLDSDIRRIREHIGEKLDAPLFADVFGGESAKATVIPINRARFEAYLRWIYLELEEAHILFVYGPAGLCEGMGV